nr:hypothetical protein [Pseudonocardiales bacterium]
MVSPEVSAPRRPSSGTYDLENDIVGCKLPDAVLAVFGVVEAPVILAGGKGGTWRAGRLALKPVEFLAETLWRAEVLT